MDYRKQGSDVVKCICGYEYKEEYCNGVPKPIVGDEEFIDIDVKATIESGGWHKGLTPVRFYACPKCGTLRCDA